MRIFNQHARSSALHTSNTPRSVAEEHDVTGQALHGKIFVDSSHVAAVGLGNDREQGIVRNRAAAGDSRQASAAPRSQLRLMRS